MIHLQRRFQALLRELFAFDCADLDFGIYRILNHKRDVIERYIREDLPTLLDEELYHRAAVERKAAKRELAKARKRLVKAWGKGAIGAKGALKNRHRDDPEGVRYLEARAALAQMPAPSKSESLEAEVYNHLFNFFSRYYDEGDFISKRRYSKRARYMIPYNGEEVHLHWANKDQHYVKTAEHLRNYAFKAADGHVSVQFAVADANVEQNNVKGQTRYFFPRYRQIAWDAATATVAIPFEFRPMTATEQRERGKNHVQDGIIAHAVAEVPKRLEKKANAERAVAALLTERRKNGDGEPVSLLEHHLRRYTRRNTSDFFIHKDLKGFLSRELDFFLKNEVLSIDGLEQSLNGPRQLRELYDVFRSMKLAGEQLIDFFAQVENFQKKLWEKRKFVTDAQYIIRVGIVHQSLHERIAKCDEQWAEWAELFGVDVSGARQRVDVLKAQPTLLIDTKHFSAEFVDELISSVAGGLEEQQDGLLVHSENYQALRLLEGRYRSGVQSIYIDPPYNTDASAILYKNDYKDSSWLSLMADRLAACRSWLTEDGSICVAIDDEEFSRLRLLMRDLFAAELGVVAVRSNPAGRKSKGQFSPCHEYALFFGNETSLPGALNKTERQLARYPLEDADGRFAWNNLVRHGSNDRREDRPKLFFPIYVAEDDALRVPRLAWSDERQAYEILDEAKPGETVVWPVRVEDGERVEKNWHRGPEKIAQTQGDYRVRRVNGGLEIDFKIRMDLAASPTTWWDESKYASANLGPRALKALFGDKNFDFAKSVPLVEDCLRAAGCAPGTTAVDFFAGSGTTGEAVMNLNRVDDGGRRFVLVEVGENFDAVVLPRLKKVAYAAHWSNGKPQPPALAEEAERSPRIIKYVRLESYEDALQSIEFSEAGVQTAMQWEDYVVKYMLDFETKYSPTLLNFQALTRPFDYKLATHRNGNGETLSADVAETFNYLIGLRVRTRKVHHDDDRRYLVYCGDVKGRTTAVIWRATDGWEEADFTRDRKFVAENNLADGAEDVYFNGAGTIRGAKPLEPLFHERMFAPLE